MNDKDIEKGKKIPGEAAQFMPTSVRGHGPAASGADAAKAVPAGAKTAVSVKGVAAGAVSGTEKVKSAPGEEKGVKGKVGAVSSGAAGAAAKSEPKQPEAKPESAGKSEKKKGLFGGKGKGDKSEKAEKGDKGDKDSKPKGSLFGRGKKKDEGESIKGSINKSLGLSSEGVREVQERLEKLTLAVTVAAAVTIFAIIFAGWTGWQSFSTTQALKASMRSVVVAVEEIPSGTTITKDMLGMMDIPAKYLSADATSDAGQIIGQRANVAIAANDQVTTKMVSGMGNTTSASAQLADGEKAITVKVDDATGMSGLIRQGDSVNVIWSNKGQVRTVVSKVRVVALDNYLSGSKGTYGYVTLALTADQVNAVRQAESIAGSKLSLALNPAGSDTEE